MSFVLVNNNEFEKYELDSISSIKDRIAYQKGLLSEQILFKVSEDEKRITTQTLPELMLLEREGKYVFPAFQLREFYDIYKDQFKDINFETFSSLWYQYRGPLDPYAEFIVDEFLKENNYSLNSLQNNFEQFIKIQQEKFTSFSNRVEEDIDILKELKSKRPFHSTPIEVVKIKTEITFEVDYDVYELFNHLKMSREVPFAVIGDYYKILNEFVPLNQWTYAKEKEEGDFKDKKDVLYLKTLNVRNEPIKNLQKTDEDLYSTVAIYFETPLEETKRKREERLKRETERERERKKIESAIKEEAKKKGKEEIVEKKPIRKKMMEKPEERLEREKREKEKKEKEDLLQKKKIDELKKEREKMKEKREKEEKLEQEMRERDAAKEENVIVRTSRVFLTVESAINSDFSEDELIGRILSTFPSKVDIQTRKQIQIKAEFLVPQFHLERPIFLELITNDPIFSRMCFVDERLHIQKEKGGVYLYFAFSPDDSEDKLLTCSMTEQIVEKTNQSIMNKDELLKINTSYLKVRITKAETKEKADLFRNIFCRLITIYNKKRKDVVNLYEKYIDDFQEILTTMKKDIEKKRRKSTREKVMLKDIVPEQFISGYSRSVCPAKREPRIVEVEEMSTDPDNPPKEVKELLDKGVSVMLYPKTPEEGKQHYYACDHRSKDKFIGLGINNLANSYKYPILPCCFAIDPRSKEKSIWREYYEQGKKFSDFRVPEESEKDIKDEKHIFITNKILAPNRFGILAKNIERYFLSIDGGNIYLRQGVTRSHNSVIESLMLARDDNFDAYDVAEKRNRAEEIRQELLENVITSDVYQNAYTYTPDTLRNYLEDNKKYLDPKMFIRMLEKYFECYIYIFSQNEQNPLGILDCPYHVKEYLQLQRKDYPIVFIYEHMGAEIDKAEYPQCELIVRRDNPNHHTSVFDSDKEVVIRTNEVFREMYSVVQSSISLPSRVSRNTRTFKTKIISQEIDYYGKTRFLQFENSICILTDPLPPLLVKQGCNYQPIEWNKANSFLREEDINEIREHIVSRKRVGVYASKNGINFYIPLIPERTSNDNEVNIITPTFIVPKSELSLYNEYHKRARCITEYMLYLFSLDYKKYQPKEIDSKYILEFVERNIVIDEEFKYKDVNRMFSINNTGVLRDRKLVLHNETIQKKLLYVLRVRLRNNIEEVKNYSDYKYIQDYYADIKDFIQTKNQPIIYGQEALHKWIENMKPKYPLYDNVLHTDASLLTELSNYDTSKLFVVLFMASWNRDSKNLMNRIYTTKRFGRMKKKEDLYTRYSNRVNFVYIDIENNKGLASAYNVSSVPYVYFYKIENEKLIEKAKIKGISNMSENVRLIENKIIDILNIK